MSRSLIFLIFCVLPQGSNNKETETENSSLDGHQDHKSVFCPPEIFKEPVTEQEKIIASMPIT